MPQILGEIPAPFQKIRNFLSQNLKFPQIPSQDSLFSQFLINFYIHFLAFPSPKPGKFRPGFGNKNSLFFFLGFGAFFPIQIPIFPGFWIYFWVYFGILGLNLRLFGVYWGIFGLIWELFGSILGLFWLILGLFGFIWG